MKIQQIKVDNFRLLQEFEIDLEHNLSLVIGKNNCGKTSLLAILEKFLIADNNTFSFEDINLEHQSELLKTLESTFDDTFYYGVQLRIYIDYDETDSLVNISSLMLDLNPDHNIVVISFCYEIDFQAAIRLKKDFDTFKLAHTEDDSKNLSYFLKRYHANYFSIRRRALEYSNEDNSIEIDKKQITPIINFKKISAKRGVDNTDGGQNRTNKTLSKLSSDYYTKVSGNSEEKESTKELRRELSKADTNLNTVYEGLFEDVVNKVKRFGGIREDDSAIKIISTLEEKNILKENTSVLYSHEEHTLPEDYNGLGYMNLIAIIFEIEVILNDFKKLQSALEVPSDINLFFIEEPEAHTHPQMQYVFIKNIKELLKEESSKDVHLNLQTILSTHSSHITAESNFDDIKYFYRETPNSVIAKNLTSLKKEYEKDPNKYQFLRQFLTLTRAELFFADKAILIEGDTERILLPTMMKKIDKEMEDKESSELPLLSQNISIVEVGAYSHVFEKFIEFLGIKTLIITDIDSVKEVTGEDGKTKRLACRVAKGTQTSNSAVKEFFGSDTKLEDLIKWKLEDKTLRKNTEANTWEQSPDGKLCIVVQTEENGYHARSFEDAFISVNRNFLNDNRDDFRGLKNKGYFDDPKKDNYDLAKECVDKKTYFALDIVYFSDENLSNWKIPQYIKEGLLWLQQ